MKTKFLISLLSLFLSFIPLVEGQDKLPNLPIDTATKKINYTEVVYVDTISDKLELFSRAREWFAKTYKSSVNVIQMEDKENGKIIGKALIRVHYKDLLGTECDGGFINYTVSIYLKDGKYKYEFTDFYHSGDIVSGGYVVLKDIGPCEIMMGVKKKGFKKMYFGFLNQMNDEIKLTIIDLKNSMKTIVADSKKDDW